MQANHTELSQYVSKVLKNIRWLLFNCFDMNYEEQTKIGNITVQSVLITFLFAVSFMVHFNNRLFY